MTIAFACDHGGFPLKERLISEIRASGAEVLDLGTNSPAAVDYPDYAEALGLAVIEGRASAGVLVCGSGVGASVAANKIPGIRAGLCHDTFSAHQGREDDDCNVLCLGARVIGPELAAEITRVWLRAGFSGLERHRRRVGKVKLLEQKYAGADSVATPTVRE
jgi:ribose 5-phosphate isomerase B